MVLDWGLNPGPPKLEASTLPLGYQGGGNTLQCLYATCMYKRNIYGIIKMDDIKTTEVNIYNFYMEDQYRV